MFPGLNKWLLKEINESRSLKQFKPFVNSTKGKDNNN